MSYTTLQIVCAVLTIAQYTITFFWTQFVNLMLRVVHYKSIFVVHLHFSCNTANTYSKSNPINMCIIIQYIYRCKVIADCSNPWKPTCGCGFSTLSPTHP